MTIKEFIAALQQVHSETSFNPWADYDPSCDIGPQAPLIRAANLKRYLELRQEARYLFIAEGLGYQGGHFSGMAMTSERILLGHHRTYGRRWCWEIGTTGGPAIRKVRF